MSFPESQSGFGEGRRIEVVVQPVALPALANLKSLSLDPISTILPLVVSGVVVAVTSVDGEGFARLRGKDGAQRPTAEKILDHEVAMVEGRRVI